MLGALRVGGGDHVVVPAGTTHRWVPDEQLRVGPGSPWARGPAGPVPTANASCGRPPSRCGPRGSGSTSSCGTGTATRFTDAHHPFDVVGWAGCLYPWALNIADFEPITGRLHQPPPVHQTLAGPNFVVCSFVPRLFDYRPQAIPASYNHANVDSDEVLFYVGGDFMSRKGAGIERGSLTLHPAGFIHARSRAASKPRSGQRRPTSPP